MIRAIFPGTFDPIHYGHIDIARRASAFVDELIVAVYDKPLKNALFNPEQRIELARQSFIEVPKIKVAGYSGLTVQFCKQVDAQIIVRGLRVFSDFEYEFRLALANHRLEPTVEVIALITNEEHTFLSSSTVREIASLGGDISSMVPEHVNLAMKKVFAELGSDQQVVPTTSMRD